MLFYKIKNVLNFNKNRTLYEILSGERKLSDVTYLKVRGYGENIFISVPTTSYRLINDMKDKFKIKERIISYACSGVMIFNSLEVVNGECKVNVKFKYIY